jgi:flagellin
MSTVINTNLASLYAQNNLSNAQNNLATSVMRLSSGLRINSAKDDAAGLAISQFMQGQINSIDQSRRNLNDATGLLQVADTAMGTIQDMLLRMKQLATQAYNGSMNADQKQNVLDEINTLNTQINNTATITKYNGNQLINQSSSPTLDVTGKNNGEAVSDLATAVFNSIDVSSAANLTSTYTFSRTAANKLQLSNGTGQTQILDVSTVSISQGATATLNFDQIGIKVTFANTSATPLTGDALATKLNDADGAGAGTAGDTIKTTAGAATSLDFQAGADTGLGNLVSFARINTRTDGAGDVSAGHASMTGLGSAITTVAGGVNVASNWSALGTAIDSAILQTSNDRSRIGALTNQISYLNQNLEAQSTNIKSSRSNIMDTDFAAETAKLTKGQIMQQAATAMLAQANQMPNVVLSLLK